MAFVKPKPRTYKVEWRVSEDAKTIIKNYAMYTGFEENELVDLLLKSVITDPRFKDWAERKRRNKRISELINKYEDEVIQKLVRENESTQAFGDD